MARALHAACGSNRGRRRNKNEDNFYMDGWSMPYKNNGVQPFSARYDLTKARVFGVFDGMGGEEAGEIAAASAANVLLSWQCTHCDSIAGLEDYLISACDSLNAAVCAKSESLPFGRMGTTTALLLFVDDKVCACNVGDSRILLYRDRRLIQLSTDDTERCPRGEVGKGALTQYIGASPDEIKLEPHVVTSKTKRNDLFIICSDGLTDMVTDLQICSCIKRHISLKRITSELIQCAMKNGGRDNITVLLVRVE